jgi:hypothetical protein
MDEDGDAPREHDEAPECSLLMRLLILARVRIQPGLSIQVGLLQVCLLLGDLLRDSLWLYLLFIRRRAR